MPMYDAGQQPTAAQVSNWREAERQGNPTFVTCDLCLARSAFSLLKIHPIFDRNWGIRITASSGKVGCSSINCAPSTGSKGRGRRQPAGTAAGG